MQNANTFATIYYADSQYPQPLQQAAELNPPKQLYVRGRLQSPPLVAIVGSRRPTDYGKQLAYSIARELVASGVGVVSGLAYGIDTMAHRGALDGGGYTLAVLGSGLGKQHPATNRQLAHQIVEQNGALITELPPEAGPRKHHFPARNRIVAGLSLAVVVVEAAHPSGSFHTIKFALNAGRQVMAVPGPVHSLASEGTNQLIREGATLVRNTADVLADLNLAAHAAAKPDVATPPADHSQAVLLKLITDGVTTNRQLIAASGLSASAFAQAMSHLEIDGRVINLGVGTWAKRL